MKCGRGCIVYKKYMRADRELSPLVKCMSIDIHRQSIEIEQGRNMRN